MISVPSDIMACLQFFLNRQPVQKEYQPYYKKWFRFYWDFATNIIIRSQNMKVSVFLSKNFARKSRKITKSNRPRMQNPLIDGLTADVKCICKTGFCSARIGGFDDKKS